MHVFNVTSSQSYSLVVIEAVVLVRDVTKFKFELRTF